jgi:hypothetical protein
LIAALTVGIPTTAVFLMSSIARERERTIAAMTELQGQLESRQKTDANVARLSLRVSELETAQAQAILDATENDLEGKKATEEIESLKRQAIALKLAMEEREKRIRDLNRDFGEWYLPQVVTAGVISVEGNRVELDLGRDNRLQIGRLLHVYHRAGLEVRKIGTIRVTEVMELRSFGLFKPANDVDWVQPGDEASDRQ